MCECVCAACVCVEAAVLKPNASEATVSIDECVYLCNVCVHVRVCVDVCVDVCVCVCMHV